MAETRAYLETLDNRALAETLIGASPLSTCRTTSAASR